MELIVSKIRRKVSLITLLDRFRNITSRRMRFRWTNLKNELEEEYTEEEYSWIDEKKI